MATFKDFMYIEKYPFTGNYKLGIRFFEIGSIAANSRDVRNRNFACKVIGTGRVLIFEGAMGGTNVGELLAEVLLRKAPAVNGRVEEVLPLMWVRQLDIRLWLTTAKFREVQRWVQDRPGARSYAS